MNRLYFCERFVTDAASIGDRRWQRRLRCGSAALELRNLIRKADSEIDVTECRSALCQQSTLRMLRFNQQKLQQNMNQLEHYQQRLKPLLITLKC